MNNSRNKLEQHALAARESIADTFTQPFSADGAVLFLLDTEGSVHELSRFVDVYEGLKQVSGTQLRPEHIGLGVFTTGWAAPLTTATESTCPPSDHPDRVKVQLCTVLDRDFQNVSVLLLEGETTPLVECDGEGSLADALTAAFVMMLRKQALPSFDVDNDRA